MVDGGFVVVVLSVELDGCGDADLAETAQENFIIEQEINTTTISNEIRSGSRENERGGDKGG